MNERIRELALQAGKWSAEEYHQLFLANESPDRQKLFNEKFAELIVRECADICRYHPSIIVSNNWSGHDVAQDIVQRFEEHFGVEE